MSAQAIRWAKENPEKHLEGIKKWQKKNPGKVRAYHTAWYSANKEKAKERLRLWRANNPDKKKEYDRNRRAHRYGSEGTHTPQQFLELCEIFGNVCVCCFERKALTEDHVIPLVKGGTDFIENIQPLCKECNSRKRVASTDYRLTFYTVLLTALCGQLQHKLKRLVSASSADN